MRYGKKTGSTSTFKKQWKKWKGKSSKFGMPKSAKGGMPSDMSGGAQSGGMLSSKSGQPYSDQVPESQMGARKIPSGLMPKRKKNYAAQRGIRLPPIM